MAKSAQKNEKTRKKDIDIKNTSVKLIYSNINVF